MADKRMFGKVKWYNADKRYGFIEGDNRKDYFVHLDNINCKQEQLRKHRAVSFLPREGGKGIAAYDVTIVSLDELDVETIKRWVEMAQAQTIPFCAQSWVYVFKGYGVGCKEEYAYKIGYSSRPRRRLKELRRKYSARIDIIHTISVSGSFFLEQILHRVFAEKKGGGVVYIGSGFG